MNQKRFFIIQTIGVLSVGLLGFGLIQFFIHKVNCDDPSTFDQKLVKELGIDKSIQQCHNVSVMAEIVSYTFIIFPSVTIIYLVYSFRKLTEEEKHGN